MISPLLAKRIEEIGRDRTRGAAELARLAVETLSLASPGELAEAAEAVARAQPAMAALYNAAQAALAGQLPEFTSRLRRSGEIIVRKAGGLLRGKVVLTHSYSSTIARVLPHVPPSRLICTESLPGGEGRTTASLLNGEVIPDATVYSVLASADVVIVGADAVTPGTIINKVGTALVALAARARGTPAWVLCGSEKYVPADWNPELGQLFEAVPREWFTGVLDDS